MATLISLPPISINKCRLLILSCFFPLVFYGQGMGVSKPRPNIPFKGQFEFEVINPADTTLQYYASLERLMKDSSWQEVRGDLFAAHYTRSAHSFSLGEGKRAMHTFVLGGPGKDFSNNVYRVMLVYYKRYEGEKKVAYSPSFTVPN